MSGKKKYKNTQAIIEAILEGDITRATVSNLIYVWKKKGDLEYSNMFKTALEATPKKRVYH